MEKFYSFKALLKMAGGGDASPHPTGSAPGGIKSWTFNYEVVASNLLLPDERSTTGSRRIRDAEAVNLQTASASTPIAAASKKIHRNIASKIRPVRW